MTARLRRLLAGPPPAPRLSFGEWGRLEGEPVVAVCHPEWRGVRTAAYGHRVPVVEVADAAPFAEELAARLAGVEVVVVHGFPPGAERLLEEAARRGLATRCVLHSSMAQHGGEAAEAAVADRVVGLLGAGTLGRLGFVKEGQAEAFRALGHPAHWVPNRLLPQPEVEPLPLGEGLQVGVFAEPFWRKNLVTQLGAVALLGGTAHVLHRPQVGYLGDLPVVEHGLLPYEQFLRLQGSVTLNLYVTLSECHPLSPLESYAAGVPCLSSPTSVLFRDDPDFWQLTTVDEIDNPVPIAEAARRLLNRAEEAVGRARGWMARFDRVAARRWAAFVAEEEPEEDLEGEPEEPAE